MRYPLRLVVLTAVLSSPLRAQRCGPGPIALVLAGGGSKGFAHVGVLRVLDSLGIRPDLVVGSSVGAMVGALYASGLSARQIDSLTRVLPSFEPSSVVPSRPPHEWGSLPAVVLWEQGTGGFRLAAGGLRELRINALLNRMLLRANLQARGDFDRLPIRFRAVATSLRSRAAVALRSGDLAQAVRASIAVPLLFSPERIGAEVYTDGGISANVPIAAARADGAKRVIVVDLKDPPPTQSRELSSPDAVAEQLASFLFTQPLDSLGPDDIYIWPDVSGVAKLKFDPLVRERLLANGRAAAELKLRAASCLTRGPVPSPRPLPSRLVSWSIANGSHSDEEAMGRILGLKAGRPLDISALEAQLADMPNIEAFRELWLGPQGEGDTVAFRAQAIRSAPRIVGIGLAYDHDLGGRLWAGALDRVSIPGVEASGILTLGRYRSDLTGIILTHLGIRRMTLMPVAAGQLRAEDVRLFIDDKGNFAHLPVRQAIGSAGVEWARLGAWRLRGTGGFVTWRTPEGDNHSTGGVLLSAQLEPGGTVSASAEVDLTGAYRLGQAELSTILGRGRLSVEPGVRIGAGSRLPIQDALELGGMNGFPGLQIGERRGDREVVARIQSSFLVRGPVALRVLVAAGRSATGGGLLDRTRWLGGVRVGVGASTPIGPVAFEYGLATNGRRAAFIRVGRWF